MKLVIAASLALVGTATAVALALNASSGAAAPAAAPLVDASAAGSLVDAADAAVQYTQQGDTVDATRDGKPVATVALSSATSDNALLTVTAKQPFVLHTDLFVLYDDNGGENNVEQAQTIRVEPGTQSITLKFPATDGPEALGWVPQDGEGAVAVWELANVTQDTHNR